MTKKRAVSPAGPAPATQRILEVAEQLVQTRGFNGFSYADVAAELGITKAALHYHFAGKAELGEALMARYSSRFEEALAELDRHHLDAADKVDGYADIYTDVLRHRRMCLCGMLAAEYDTLPTSMQREVVAFFEMNEVWLSQTLEEGRNEGTLAFAGPPIGVARTIMSSLEGAMLVARPFDDIARFERVVDQLTSGLKTRPEDAGGSGRPGSVRVPS